MPQSRKRPGHQYHKPAEIPSSQRTKGRVIWAILFAVFALMVGFFASDGNIVASVIATIPGAIVGFLIGKQAEKMK